MLIANEDYVSNQLAFLSLQKRWNIQLIRAGSIPEGGVDVADMERLMDMHDRTRSVDPNDEEGQLRGEPGDLVSEDDPD